MVTQRHNKEYKLYYQLLAENLIHYKAYTIGERTFSYKEKYYTIIQHF